MLVQIADPGPWSQTAFRRDHSAADLHYDTANAGKLTFAIHVSGDFHFFHNVESMVDRIASATRRVSSGWALPMV